MALAVFLGPAEYTLWSTLFRMVGASALATLAYQVFFASRPGLPLLMNLSIPSAVPVAVRQTLRKFQSGQPAQGALVLLLTLVAATGLIADWAMSSALANLQRTGDTRLAWVQQTNAAVRPFVASASVGRAVPRESVYAAIRAAVPAPGLAPPDAERDWVRTSGTITEIDAAAGILYPDTCPGGEPVGSKLQPVDLSHLASPAVGRRAFAETTQFMHRRSSVFGFQVKMYSVQLFSAADPNFQNKAAEFAVPVPLVYTTESAGQTRSAMATGGGAVTDQTQAIYGAAVVKTAVQGYSMRCGLTSDDVKAWIDARAGAKDAVAFSEDRDPKSTKLNVGPFMYLDMSQYDMDTSGSTYGTSHSLLLHATADAVRAGTIEALSFGSEVSGDLYTKRTSLATASDIHFRNVSASHEYYAARSGLGGAIDQSCVPADRSLAQFKPNTVTPNDELAAVRAANPYSDILKRNGNRKAQRCTLSARGGSGPLFSGDKTVPASNDKNGVPLLVYLSGAQVCKTKMTLFPMPSDAARNTSLADGKADNQVDLVAAMQIAPQPQAVAMRCLPRTAGSDGLSQVDEPSFFGGALTKLRDSDETAGKRRGDGWALLDLAAPSSGGWVTATPKSVSGSGTAKRGYETNTDADGPQLYTRTAVRVELWLLLVSAAAFLAVIVFASVLQWGSQNALALASAYEYAYYPRDTDQGAAAAMVGNGIGDIDVMQPTTMALVEVPGVGDSPPAYVVRLVPVDKDGKAYLPQARFRGTVARAGSEQQTVAEETIVATSLRYADLEVKARAAAQSSGALDGRTAVLAGAAAGMRLF
ncbi:hypothetical protein H9P43_005217 [Blastocladiella emersonii ATCC 22665]|nr:hypothetical protein H9P43_005217 [Blastocladiella emersonii ATCC 22665]